MKYFNSDKKVHIYIYGHRERNGANIVTSKLGKGGHWMSLQVKTV